MFSCETILSGLIGHPTLDRWISRLSIVSVVSIPVKLGNLSFVSRCSAFPQPRNRGRKIRRRTKAVSAGCLLDQWCSVREDRDSPFEGKERLRCWAISFFCHRRPASVSCEFFDLAARNLSRREETKKREREKERRAPAEVFSRSNDFSSPAIVRDLLSIY